MTPLQFQQPDQVLLLQETKTFGKFEFRPLEPGYGITIGNALRRILLSSLQGYAIAAIKIEGIQHEFQTIPGVTEDIVNIILNLKQVRLKPKNPTTETAKTSLIIAKANTFSAADIAKKLTTFEVLNPQLIICHLERSAKLHIELHINKGRGYTPAEENTNPDNNDPQIIPIDSIYTPIRNVKYSVDNFRVQQKTDYEKLTIEITTDGSIQPKQALKQAANILIQHLALFSDQKITTSDTQPKNTRQFNEEILQTRQLLKTKLSDPSLQLSIRALNCLKAADIETLQDLVQYNKNELLKFRNFGKKSLNELELILANKKISFGMDLDKYKLDKD